MSKPKRGTHRVSSPAATGGAGTFFEQHTNATFLALLLVRGVPPICPSCRVVEVHLQTEHEGWNTDDFMVVGETGVGDRKRLVGQIKRSFAVSYSDDDFKGAILDAWQDFKSKAVFDVATDHFVIVTLLGSNTVLRYFTALLDCARASVDGDEFNTRLTTPGFVHSKVVAYCDEIRKILDEQEGRAVTFDELRDFLRLLYLLSFDLNSATAQTEAWIKTLLAHTSDEHDPIAAASDSWNALLQEVGSGTPQARVYRRDDLPEVLRKRHSPVTAADDAAIQALRDQTAFVLGGIRNVIGQSVHLRRTAVVSRIVTELEDSQVVLVAGEAGGGKSGVAKGALEELTASGFAFAFRAEQFAATHLDPALSNVHAGLSARKIRTLLAAHDRKVILIESVERLLEASNRGAFTDLMTMLSQDRSWRLILTCRDYSADLVRSSFLESAGMQHAVVAVPPLDDGELDEVCAGCPRLLRPLSSEPLRRLLRNPYFLDMAARLTWPDDTPLPGNERSLRKKFWREAIRDDAHAGDGMPRRREQVFVEVALRRARALTAFAPCDDLDGVALDRLRNSSLLRVPPQTETLAAAAHDVLEDWALLEWIEQQFALAHESLPTLCSAMGTYPAIRRTYKRWLEEQVALEPQAADRLFDEAIAGGGLPQHFVDDTLVSILRSSRAPELLERRSDRLFADGHTLLLRMLHLLRVGCVTTPSWAASSPNLASIMCVPDGGAWASLLNVVRRHLGQFAAADISQLLSFVEDWSRGVSWQAPYPEGAGDAAAIVLDLLPKFDDYRHEEQRKRLLSILVKIPLACRDRFLSLLDTKGGVGQRDQRRRDLEALLVNSMEGFAACRDLPDEVIALARRKFLLTDKDAEERDHWGSSMEMEPLFGLRSFSHDFFPASAYRGPFLFLLRSHPQKGLVFIIELINHATEWYAHPRYPMEYVEPPVEMVLRFSDETTRKQWVNDRLWNLYRGTSVGPYLLQSALMALERWLLETCEFHPQSVDSISVRLLRETTSAAITSVVASVATAFPALAHETGLVLLRSPECIFLDKMRMAHESQSPGRLTALMPLLDASKKIFDNERKDADAMPHRSKDLEIAALNLQLGPTADRVHAILDEHRASLPSPSEQDDDIRSWRLSLDRMDLRRYRAATKNEHPAPAKSSDVSGSQQASVFIEMETPDPDVQEMVERTQAEHADLNSSIGLLMWGIGVFERNEKISANPDEWRQRLDAASEIEDKIEGTLGGIDPKSSARAFVAAVCIRDHWPELKAEDQDWCVETTCGSIAARCDETNDLACCQRYSMSGDRPAAWIVSLLSQKELSEHQRTRVSNGLAQALTHGIDEVSDYAALGAAEHLWEASPALALRCVNALARQAEMLQAAFEEEKKKHFNDRRRMEVLKAETVPAVRNIILGQESVHDEAYRTFDTTRWVGAHTMVRLLTIVQKAPHEDVAKWLFRRASETLRHWWRLDEGRRERDVDQRPRDVEPTTNTLLERFVLRVPIEDAITILTPILEEVEGHPREVSWIIRGLTSAEDMLFRPANFWAIWSEFATRIRQSNLLDRIDDSRYSRGDELVSAIFLGSWWKDEVRHWRSLEGYADCVHGLFLALPPSATVLDDYVRFLYHIGEQSLPKAFVYVSNRLREGTPARMLSKSNTLFMLESLLRRYVYGRPMETKRDREVRECVLELLDRLVEAGSSAAYRMRDDFVTPLPQ